MRGVCDSESVIRISKSSFVPPLRRLHVRQDFALPRLALIGVLAPIVAAGCSSEKSRNPLSPNVAGPIAGVTISTPKTLQPANGSEITVGSNIDLLIENAT